MVDALRESLILHSLDFSFAYLEKKVYFTLLQCPFRVFFWRDKTLDYVVLLEQHFYSSRFASCSRLIHLPRKATCQIKSTQSENKLPLFLICFFVLLCFEPHCSKVQIGLS